VNAAILALALISPALSIADPDSVVRKYPSGYEVTTLTVKGAEARKIFRELQKAGYQPSLGQGTLRLETSAITCTYDDPERMGHFSTHDCSGGETAALPADMAKEIAPRIVTVNSFPNEKELLEALPGGYTTQDMGRGITAWEKVDCKVSARGDLSQSVCKVIFRSDY
jgi:hypothetical protein